MTFRRRLTISLLATLQIVYILLSSLNLNVVQPFISRQEFNLLKNSKCAYLTPDGSCFDLWVAEHVDDSITQEIGRIFIIVSHCLQDLDWLHDYVTSFNIYRIDIISKCNKPVTGAPISAKIVKIKNVGRCDHSYAYWMSTIKEHVSLQSNDVAVFLKDDMSTSNIHQISSGWQSFQSLVSLAAKSGFSCGLRPTSFVNGSLSAFHETVHLMSFSNHEYNHNHLKYKIETDFFPPFKSQYPTMKEWISSIGNISLFPENVTQVCYGGVFATKLKQIFHHNDNLWQNIVDTLSRGNNIEEGHFVERSWAALLAKPLSFEDQERLWMHSSYVLQWYGAYMGTLVST